MKTLLILESGTKIDKFRKILGKTDYIFSASFGHIRDLEQKKMSIDVDNNFKPTYRTIPGKTSVINNIKKLYKECDAVLLACDNDREGESISWHLSEVLKLKQNDRKRLIFNEITKSAIIEAVKTPKNINMNMVYAQQARRLLDRIIGFTVSPILWKHIHNSYSKEKTLSAGRVQSVVLSLIIERENEIKKFKSENSYKIDSIFISSGKDISCELNKELENKKETQLFLEKCHKALFMVTEIKKGSQVKKPSPPFITSTLQQESSNRFRMSPKNTMLISQKLYEKGHITYHRTDSVILSSEAKENIQKYIVEHFGETYFKNNSFENKTSNCQEAHEAIRPSNIFTHPDDLNPNEEKLYKLIWERTISSMMSDSKTELTSSIIKSDTILKYFFTYKTERVLFDGFMKLQNKKETQTIYTPKKKEIIDFKTIKGTEKYSKPKLRYTEAGLIKKLEELGIGRPSTYASMTNIVQERNYVEKKDIEGVTIELDVIEINKNDTDLHPSKIETINGSEKQKLVPTDIGTIVNTFMVKNFSYLITPDYTSIIEQKLDDIYLGKLKWYDFLKNIYSDLMSNSTALITTSSLEKEKYKRVLGKHTSTKGEIVCYIGPYGPVVRHTVKNKHNYAPLNDIRIEDITLNEAVALLEYPKKIGKYKSKDVVIKKGKNGLYINHDKKNYSIQNDCSLEEATEIIKNKKNNVIKQISDEIIIKNGQYGPYIHYKNKYFISIKSDPNKLTEKDCLSLIKAKYKN
jgi:DNA topoisomerase-1